MTQLGFLNCSKKDIYFLQNQRVLDQFSIHGWMTDSATVGNVCAPVYADQ
jgi:hypothetical protein